MGYAHFGVLNGLCPFWIEVSYVHFIGVNGSVYFGLLNGFCPFCIEVGYSHLVDLIGVCSFYGLIIAITQVGD